MYIKKNIAVMYAMALLQGMIFYGPVATLYRQAAGVGIFEITLIESLSLGLCVALELPCGILADKIGYKNMLLGCSGLYFLSKIVFWQASGFWMFLCERLMLSAVMAGLSGLDTSILYLSCPPNKTQRVFGAYYNLNTAGLLAAAGVYALFIGDNYRLAGLLTVISYGAAAVLALLITDVKPPEKCPGAELREFKSILRSAAKDPGLIMLAAGAALLNETHQTVTVFLNQLQYVRAGMDNRTIGAVYIAVTLTGLVGAFSARATARLGEKRLGCALFGLCAAACIVMAATANPLLSAASVIVLRAAFSLFTPLQTQLQNRRISSSNRATALSVNAVMMEGVAIATNLAFGAAADSSVSLAMALGAALCGVGALLFAASLRPPRIPEDKKATAAE